MAKKTPSLITTIPGALVASGPRPADNAPQKDKKNYAERLSRNIATCIANGLRKAFPGVLPTETGTQQESQARTSKGLKKLDVNYSTLQLGLGLGVSIKTINFKDNKTNRYTKNYSRNDNELRAEATDYHQRQPFSVLVALLFLPLDSCDDGKTSSSGGTTTSSFGRAVKFFRPRANRQDARDDIELFERFFIGLYDPTGTTVFFDVMNPPPRSRRPRPEETLNFEQVLEAIRDTYDLRNNPPFEWAEE